MDLDGECNLRWIDAEDFGSFFLPQPFPPRGDRGSLGPLVRSIRETRCVAPIIARPHLGKLQVVTGWRRFLAAQAVRLEAVPVLVRDLSDQECAQIFTAECQRAPDPVGIPSGTSGPARPGVDSRSSNREGNRLEEIVEGPALIEGPAAMMRRMARLLREGPAAPEANRVAGSTERSVEKNDAGIHCGLDGLRDSGMSGILRRTINCFRAIALNRAIPVEEVERIASDLISLAPVRRGRDIRSFCDAEVDQVVSHSLLVTGLGIHLAQSLDWTGGQIKKFALACLLHDIGMLFIPRTVLQEPRELTRKERDLVELHPEMGREIIQSSHAWGAQIHLVAQDHHERWNGSGYPRRRKGKEIDLPSRMVSFLDCFGALVSARPHRTPQLYSQALKTMAGLTELGHYDPSVLAHFRNVFTEYPVGSCLKLKDGRTGWVVGRDSRGSQRIRLKLWAGKEMVAEDPLVWIDSGEAVAAEIHPTESCGPATRPQPQEARQAEAMVAEPLGN